MRTCSLDQGLERAHDSKLESPSYTEGYADVGAYAESLALAPRFYWRLKFSSLVLFGLASSFGNA
jgi:hypothetical protein